MSSAQSGERGGEEKPWNVFKFGGTSMGTVDSLQRSLAICDDHIRSNGGRLATVVSAMSGVTDTLLRASALAEKRDPEYARVIETVEARHVEAATALAGLDEGGAVGGTNPSAGLPPVSSPARAAKSVHNASATLSPMRGRSVDEAPGDAALVYPQDWFSDGPAVVGTGGADETVVAASAAATGPGMPGGDADARRRRALLDRYLDYLARACDDLRDLLKAVWVARHCPPALTAAISGAGETLSAPMFAMGAAALQIGRGRDEPRFEVRGADSRAVIVIESAEDSSPVVDWGRSQAAADAEWAFAHPVRGRCAALLTILPGFVCQDAKGVPSTLRRNGSDFSASIVGALLSAAEVTIWTDVDGVYSADPRIVPQARRLGSMSYEEAMELSNCGAKVLHAQTMAPAVRRGVPIRVKSTFDPSSCGTVIGGTAASSSSSAAAAASAATSASEVSSAVSPASQSAGDCVKGVVTIKAVSLLTLEGSGMVGVPGVSERLFGCLRRVSVSVILIAQASSEHSICIVVRAEDADKALGAVNQEFYRELDLGMTGANIEGDCAVLAAVGDGMSRTVGVAAAIFRALAAERINVRAIAQGSGERNISIVVSAVSEKDALRAVHSACIENDIVI